MADDLVDADFLNEDDDYQDDDDDDQCSLLARPAQEYLDEYKEYYKHTYPFKEAPSKPTHELPAGACERTRAFREAEIRRAGGLDAFMAQRLGQWDKDMDAWTQERLESLLLQRAPVAQQVRTATDNRAATAIARRYRQYTCGVDACINLKPKERDAIDPAYRIRLTFRSPGGGQMCLCYDIITLYHLLITKYGPNPGNWVDPYIKQLYDIDRLYSSAQIRAIQDMWQRVSSTTCKGKLKPLYVRQSYHNNILIPPHIYEKLTIKGLQYLIFRLYNAAGQYEYIVPDGPIPIGTPAVMRNGSGYAIGTYDGNHSNSIYLPPELMSKLDVIDNGRVWMRACTSLERISDIVLRPLTPQWRDLPDTALDDIGEDLTKVLEKRYIVSTRDVLTINYGDREYSLRVDDIRAGGRRVRTGITKYTQVNVHFTAA